MLPVRIYSGKGLPWQRCSTSVCLIKQAEVAWLLSSSVVNHILLSIEPNLLIVQVNIRATYRSIKTLKSSLLSALQVLELHGKRRLSRTRDWQCGHRVTD